MDPLLVQCWQEVLQYIQKEQSRETGARELEKIMKPWKRYVHDTITYIIPARLYHGLH